MLAVIRIFHIVTQLLCYYSVTGYYILLHITSERKKEGVMVWRPAALFTQDETQDGEEDETRSGVFHVGRFIFLQPSGTYY